MSNERPRAYANGQLTPAAAEAAAKRRAREAQALRDNLARRKAQARARRDGDAADPVEVPTKSTANET